MTRRRFWAIPGLTGIALLVALPFGPLARASAATSAAMSAATTASAGGLNVTIDSPGEGQRLTSPGATVSGQVTTAALLAKIDRVEVRFSYRGTVFHTTTACDPCGTETTIPFSVTSPAFDLNGPYGMEVLANGHVLLNGIGSLDGGASRSVTVAVPPDPPTAVTAIPQADRTVKLTWKAPATPADFLGYAVYRKVGSGGFGFLGVTNQTSFTDDKTAQIEGSIQYQVASVREGAAPGDHDTALQTPSAAVPATLTPLPTTSTVPGATTTTLQPGGGNQAGGAASVDLSGLLPPAAQLPSFPPAAPPPTLPDTGFSTNLPFPSTSAPVLPVEGRQRGNTAAAASGAGQVQSGGAGDNTNRRALLIPVAAGSVLCVTALHLRWLNRRLAVPAAAAAARLGGPNGPRGPNGPDGPKGSRGPDSADTPRTRRGASVSPRDVFASGAGDLDALPPEPGEFLPEAEPVRVGAGAGPRSRLA